MKQTLYLLLFTLQLTAQSTVLYHDFDCDGKKDKVYIIKTEEGSRLCYQLSSKKYKTVSSQLFYESVRLTIERKKNNLVLTNDGMRYFDYFTFSYDKHLNQFKLIKVDEERYGNCVGDDSGTFHYNLLTGNSVLENYRYDKAKKRLIKLPVEKLKRPIKKYLLKDFGETMMDEIFKTN